MALTNRIKFTESQTATMARNVAAQVSIMARYIATLEQEIKDLKKPKYESGYLRAKFG